MYLKTNCHNFVCGMTQNGKTYFTRSQLEQTDRPVIFINPQYEDTKFIKATMKNDFKQIEKVLKSGGKVNYCPSLDDETASKELEYLIDKLFQCGFSKNGNNIIVAIDEVHIFSNYKNGKLALKKIANRGLTFGLNAVFISQRPANVEYTVLTQSDNHVLFKTGLEKEYFNRKGIPYEELTNKIESKGKYSFCVWNGIELQGAFKI